MSVMNTNKTNPTVKYAALGFGGMLAVIAATAAPWLRGQSPESAPMDARVVGKSQVEAGRYLVLIGGCNDCHTPGYDQKGRAVPEEQWLTGVPLGWRGPWGTTYPSNLRLVLSKFQSAEEFVSMCRTRNARPPMPWESLHSMSDDDLKSIYAYIKSLPVTGEPTPQYVPPGAEPKTPYLLLDPDAARRVASVQ
jgi:mono/diheme cytochrome c family protein